jgi:hypothetical protein
MAPRDWDYWEEHLRTDLLRSIQFQTPKVFRNKAMLTLHAVGVILARKLSKRTLISNTSEIIYSNSSNRARRCTVLHFRLGK